MKISSRVKQSERHAEKMASLVSLVGEVNCLIDGDLKPEEIRSKFGQLSDGVISLSESYEDTLKSHEIMERQFLQAQKMEAVGTLVGGIAHDFNNMLAGMNNNLYLVKKKMQGSPDALKNITSIEQLSLRGAELIRQLLTFARKDRVTMKAVRLSPFINETIQLIRSSIPENIEIRHNITTDSLQISGNKTQIHQVLMNLISNAHDALKGVDDSHIIVRLKAFHADDQFVKRYSGLKRGYYARLSVEDNGCGIPNDHIEHLFEPFFTTKEVGKGTGLGLAMVFGAVQTHHGLVDVESVVGKGSVFSIYLPLLESEEATSEVPYEEVAATGSGEMILLVDDDMHILESGKAVLEDLGYTVMRAMNGLDAVDTFTTYKNDISLIIMDLVMPRLGGVMAVERIRKIKPDIKVIYSTGYDKEGSLPGQVPLGTDGVILSKPYNVEELSKTIRNQLDL